MDRQYYKEYYQLERTHWWFRVRAEILGDYVRRRIAAGKKIRILNIGAATGATSTLLEKFGEVASLEYDLECCEFLREELGMEVVNGSILELPYAAESFDLVCAFDVIEHVEDDRLAVDEMKRVCRKGGHILITVPAFQSLWSQHDVVNHHFRRYKLSQLDRLFKESGNGKKVHSSYFNSLLFPPIWIFRRLSQLSGRKKDAAASENSGSDFSVMNNRLLNKVMYGIFKTEFYLLKGIRFPAGVSILYHWKKTG